MTMCQKDLAAQIRSDGIVFSVNSLHGRRDWHLINYVQEKDKAQRIIETCNVILLFVATESAKII